MEEFGGRQFISSKYYCWVGVGTPANVRTFLRFQRCAPGPPDSSSNLDRGANHTNISSIRSQINVAHSFGLDSV